MTQGHCSLFMTVFLVFQLAPKKLDDKLLHDPGMFTDGKFYAASFSPTGVLKPRVSKMGFKP